MVIIETTPGEVYKSPRGTQYKAVVELARCKDVITLL